MIGASQMVTQQPSFAEGGAKAPKNDGAFYGVTRHFPFFCHFHGTFSVHYAILLGGPRSFHVGLISLTSLELSLLNSAMHFCKGRGREGSRNMIGASQMVTQHLSFAEGGVKLPKTTGTLIKLLNINVMDLIALKDENRWGLCPLVRSGEQHP